MASIINHSTDEHAEWQMPMPIASLADFRTWTYADDFPERGRIDFINGIVEVDMSPEELFSHGSVKSHVAGKLLQIVEEFDLGHLWIDSTRIVSSPGNLSVEPDIVFVSHDSFDAGKIKLIPGTEDPTERHIELEGAVDLIVEVVSKSSVTKDNRRLRDAYAAAGVSEYWIIDARKDAIQFEILQLQDGQYALSPQDDAGFCSSNVFDRSFQLTRHRGRGDRWQYRLKHS